MAIANTGNNKNVAQLNSFLRGEMSAVETYRIAIDKLDPGSPALSQLFACAKSHERRVAKLMSKIRAAAAAGRDPSDGEQPEEAADDLTAAKRLTFGHSERSRPARSSSSSGASALFSFSF
jgi:hypothetical protein